ARRGLGGGEPLEGRLPVVGMDRRVLESRGLAAGAENLVEFRRPVHAAVLEVVVVQPEPADLGGDPEPFLATADRVLGLLPLGDVHPDAVQDRRPAVLVRGPAATLHPAPRSVGVDEPELDDVIVAALDRAGHRGAHRGPIVGMDAGEEGAFVPLECTTGQAEQLLELRAPGDLLGPQVALPPADLAAAHREREGRLRAAEPVLGVADRVDVGRGPVPERAVAARCRHRDPAAEVPAVRPVGHPGAVLVLVLGARCDRRRPRGDRPGQVVGVDHRLPLPAVVLLGPARGIARDPPAVLTDDPVRRRDPHQVRDGVGQTVEMRRALGPDVHRAVRRARRQASSFDFMHSKVWPIILLAVPSISRAPSEARLPEIATSALQSIRVPPSSPSLRAIWAVASTALPGAWPWALITARSGGVSSAISMFTTNRALMNPIPTLAVAL